MYMYPAWVDGWDVETSHPIEENEEEPTCDRCLSAVEPTVAFAADFDSTAHQHQFTDGEGNVHTIVVRQIVAP